MVLMWWYEDMVFYIVIIRWIHSYIYDMSNYIHQMKTSTDIENLIASVNQRMIAYARWYIIEKNAYQSLLFCAT